MEEKKVQEQKPLEIQVPEDVAMQLKLLEFDRNIAMAKAQVADLERQKVEFIYQTSIQGVAAKYGAPAQPVQPAPQAEAAPQTETK